MQHERRHLYNTTATPPFRCVIYRHDVTAVKTNHAAALNEYAAGGRGRLAAPFRQRK